MSSFCFTSPLADLSVIDVSGADAVSFLHGQLTHEIAALAPDRAHLTGYCTAKGRLLGTMVVWHAVNSETPMLRILIKADIAEAVAKRLRMFVLRAKVTLTVNRPCVLGATAQEIDGGEPVAAGPADAGIDYPALQSDAAALPSDPAPWAVVHTQAGDWIAAPRAQPATARWWLIASGAPLENAAAAGAEPSAWQVEDIAAGLPWVQAATQDLFIPQTLNLDLIDGVSFTKGCYPGQEVVARSHYRGTVKRRMAYGLVQQASGLDAAAQPGTDTFDALKPDNPCGRVINAAKGRDADALHLLMEVQLADLDSADFRLHAPNGPAISLRPMPYDITGS